MNRFKGIPLLTKSYFQKKKILCTGIAGVGKTYLARAISSLFKTVVYTPHPNEWVNTGALVISTPDFIADFPFWCGFIKRLRGKIELFVMDEMDLLFKTHFDVCKELKDLVINHRHYNLTLLGVSKRPQNVPTQVYGEFEILCLFSVDSPQVIDLLNKYAEGLGDTVAKLGYKSYNFVLKHIGEPVRVVKI